MFLWKKTLRPLLVLFSINVLVDHVNHTELTGEPLNKHLSENKVVMDKISDEIITLDVYVIRVYDKYDDYDEKCR